jgi:hypothetical protein
VFQINVLDRNEACIFRYVPVLLYDDLILRKAMNFGLRFIESRGCIRGTRKQKIMFTQHLLLQTHNSKLHRNAFSTFGDETCGKKDKHTSFLSYVLLMYFGRRMTKMMKFSFPTRI